MRLLRSVPLHSIIFWLRISLGLIFMWFGLLKLAGFNPVFDIVYSSFPFLAEGIGNIALGFFEAFIGFALLTNLLPELAHMALIGHLFGTMSVFLLAPHIVFDPHFPFLSLAGEFVFKNVTLLIAGFAVLKYIELHGHKKQ